ncbi:hypothetical protein MMYC01_207804 [Madurella mycetomatis]|uniref:Uncharacterized protein n=1 Tax=Madurella mycetomatis TaxID=100816 RepID=A0A175VX34_9PEZI|nr:hypothetical protein MMYC01_207804 [Madurella mycetomatis]
MNATPFQNSVLPGRMDQILPSTQWAGSESTRQDFQIGMQQDHPIQQSAFPVAQPSSGDIYPSHQGPVFYTDPRQPSTPQAQGHDTFTYGTQADGYYQNTQGAFGGWQHMPGSDGGRREG